MINVVQEKDCFDVTESSIMISSKPDFFMRKLFLCGKNSSKMHNLSEFIP
jgi:hypothetical protein